MTPELQATIDGAIQSNEVLLFMKGSRSAPACGFSARTVEVLDSLLTEYATVDVLAHPEVREAIKEYSSWPTIPQLYVRGKFIGGADIVGQMFEDGSLEQALGLSESAAALPTIHLSDRAREALVEYLGDSSDVVLLEVDKEFQAGLSLGPRPQAGICLDLGGVQLILDRLSGSRADGLSIDYVDTADGPAFKIKNPNEPPKVKQLSTRALARLRETGEAHRLLDVRTFGEWQTAHVEGASLLDDRVGAELEALSKDTPLIFMCHHGHRSQRAAEHYLQKGFREVFNLVGGIDAWSAEIDATVPRY